MKLMNWLLLVVLLCVATVTTTAGEWQVFTEEVGTWVYYGGSGDVSYSTGFGYATASIDCTITRAGSMSGWIEVVTAYDTGYKWIPDGPNDTSPVSTFSYKMDSSHDTIAYGGSSSSLFGEGDSDADSQAYVSGFCADTSVSGYFGDGHGDYHSYYTRDMGDWTIYTSESESDGDYHYAEEDGAFDATDWHEDYVSAGTTIVYATIFAEATASASCSSPVNFPTVAVRATGECSMSFDMSIESN